MMMKEATRTAEIEIGQRRVHFESLRQCSSAIITNLVVYGRQPHIIEWLDAHNIWWWKRQHAQLRWRAVSVEFTLRVSANARAPSSPILLSTVDNHTSSNGYMPTIYDDERDNTHCWDGERSGSSSLWESPPMLERHHHQYCCLR